MSARAVAARSEERQILLVDDEPSMTRVISRLLARHGFEATVTDDPSSAVELVRERPGFFSLVITDMAMPGMSGDELALQLKALAPNLPIILSTGGGDGPEHLFAGVLLKPFDAPTLVDTVERCLHRSG
jgi:DNA-binding NtrC family response regulator